MAHFESTRQCTVPRFSHLFDLSGQVLRASTKLIWPYGKYPDSCPPFQTFQTNLNYSLLLQSVINQIFVGD